MRRAGGAGGAVRGLGFVLIGLALCHSALAQKSADTLRVTWRDAIPDVDPYYNQQRAGLVLAHQAWDTLVYRDPITFAIKPLLATSWKLVDDTTLEFELRRGVRFHDGAPFSAEDVVYTVNTVLADRQVSVPSNYIWMAGAEKVDDYKVRLRLKRVFPAALEYLAMVLPIWPKAYRERVGAEEYARRPVGAGPYRISAVDGNREIDLERFEDYYPDSPKGRPAIRRIVIHQVADAATEMAELLGARADWIWNFPADSFDKVAAVPSLQALRAESMRVGYLALDAAGRTGAGNPLTQLKVRQAIFHAINRVSFVRNLVPGGRVLDAPCFPTQFGCEAAAAVRYDYNPAKAKALLAEAGYPDGFDTQLYTYALPQWGGAVQNDLRAVGIRAHIAQLQVAAVIQAVLDGKTPLQIGSWGSYSVNDVSAFLPFFFTGSGNDYAQDGELRKLVEAGGATSNADLRRKAYGAAIKRITENAYFLPMHTYVTTYGIARTLNFRPDPDELPRFFLSSWK